MYKENLALNNLQGFTCRRTKLTQPNMQKYISTLDQKNYKGQSKGLQYFGNAIR